MTTNAQRILAEAMALDPTDREELAERLLGSIEPSTDPDYEAAWESELKARLDDMDAGRVKMIPADKALEMIRRGPSDDDDA